MLHPTLFLALIDIFFSVYFKGLYRYQEVAQTTQRILTMMRLSAQRTLYQMLIMAEK